MTAPPPPLRFTYDDAEAAYDRCKFNCGPAALCAALGMTIVEFEGLSSAEEFKRKGYTNPTLMQRLLKDARAVNPKVDWVTRVAGERTDLWLPAFGLARIQWGGPWTKPGVPMAARYRKTHWVATYADPALDRHQGPLIGYHVFDVNALGATRTVLGIPGWIRLEEWAVHLVSRLLEGYPRADGSWWVTHAIEVKR